MRRNRRAKIVATIGPASDKPEQIAELIDAGVNVFRLGTAHDDIEMVLARVATIRQVADEKNSPAAVLVDLAEPEQISFQRLDPFAGRVAPVSGPSAERVSRCVLVHMA